MRTVLTAAVLAVSGVASAQPVVAPVGSAGSTNSRALAVSHDGGVWAGMERIAPRDQRGVANGVQLLPVAGRADAQVFGVSGHGLVKVGISSRGGQTVATVWDSVGTPTALAPVPGTVWTRASAADGFGSTVVGIAQRAAGGQVPVRWTAAGVQVLQTLGDSPNGQAHGVNADGSLAVGQVYHAGSQYAVVWGAAGTFTVLAGPAPLDFYNAAKAVSADGSVRWGWVHNGAQRPVRWAGLTPTECSTLGAAYLDVFGCDPFGDYAGGQAGGRAAVWRADGTGDYLSDLLASQGADLAGWTEFRAVYGIGRPAGGMVGEAGPYTVVGVGVFGGTERGFVVTGMSLDAP